MPVLTYKAAEEMAALLMKVTMPCVSGMNFVSHGEEMRKSPVARADWGLLARDGRSIRRRWRKTRMGEEK
eukprot:2808429-Pyramimonas_sp.AAC.1